VRAHLIAAGSAVRTTVVYTGPVATAIADSDSHLPDRWRGATTPTDPSARELAAAAAQMHGMAPDEVAELVHQAVEQGRPTVFTHPDRLRLVRAHLTELAADVEQAVGVR
jgi:short-subunit dehydrogenase